MTLYHLCVDPGIEKHRFFKEECDGSVVECLTRDQGVADLSLTGGTALCSRVGHLTSA